MTRKTSIPDFQPIYNRFFKETGDQLGGHNTPIYSILRTFIFPSLMMMSRMEA